MELPFKKGDRVEQVVYVLKGEVVDVVLTDDNTKVQYVVQYTDLQGEEHRRPFTFDQIKISAE